MIIAKQMPTYLWTRNLIYLPQFDNSTTDTRTVNRQLSTYLWPIPLKQWVDSRAIYNKPCTLEPSLYILVYTFSWKTLAFSSYSSSSQQSVTHSPQPQSLEFHRGLLLFGRIRPILCSFAIIKIWNFILVFARMTAYWIWWMNVVQSVMTSFFQITSNERIGRMDFFSWELAWLTWNTRSLCTLHQFWSALMNRWFFCRWQCGPPLTSSPCKNNHLSLVGIPSE